MMGTSSFFPSEPERPMASAALARIARYLLNGVAYYGRIDEDHLVRWSAAPWEGGVESGPRDARDRTQPLAPVVPTKIICVGLNYPAHAAESATVLPRDRPAEPLLFFKPPSAVIAGGDSIQYPPGVTRLDPEGELAVVIGRRTRRNAPEQARSAIAGLTCFNDVSARNYQRQDGQWTRAKGFDTFAPLGPWVVMGLDPEGRDVECRVNGERRQHGNTRDLTFSIPYLIAYISNIMTLEPGDVIATGTPAGIAPVSIGDRIEVEVDGIGVLENTVGVWDS